MLTSNWADKQTTVEARHGAVEEAETGGAAKVAEARQLSIAKAQSGKFWEGSPPLPACLPVLAASGARALISLTRPTLRKVARAAH